MLGYWIPSVVIDVQILHLLFGCLVFQGLTIKLEPVLTHQLGFETHHAVVCVKGHTVCKSVEICLTKVQMQCTWLKHFGTVFLPLTIRSHEAADLIGASTHRAGRSF